MESEMVDVEDGRSRTVDSEIAPAPIFAKPNFPVTLKFDNVVYKITLDTGGKFPSKNVKKREEKLILKGISGVVRRGEMLAMLGPSGSGKTTLLTALGGRLGNGHLTGAITYNNKPFSNPMKRHTGFVMQDDLLHPHLTVAETLIYTALLRLPKTLSKSDKVQHAEAVIVQLGLSLCRNGIIGGPLLRGLSGGERKRVSIGQEMLINPSLLYLDEPTSGLDSTTALRIVSTLWELANGGRTIVMTIHQPSSRLFYMFHKVLLLSEGNPVYFGKASTALDYFSSLGFSPSIAMNPADVLLDLANGVLKGGESTEDQVAIKQTLVLAYKTKLSQIVELEINAQDDVDGNVPIDNKHFKQWPNSWSEQFSVLFKRGIKERKHESYSWIKIFQIIIVAVVTGLLWWRSTISHLQDQVGLIFFVSSFWGFHPLFQAIFMFPQERAILAKERSSGMYRLSSYFMALTMGDMPMELVLPTAFYTIIYWMGGLKPSPGRFFAGLFSLLYGVLGAQGLGLAIGATVMDFKSATVLGTVLMLTFQLASGYFVQHVPAFIAWIKYLSISQYTFKLMLLSQYKIGETYPCEPGGKLCFVEDFPGIKVIGLDGAATAAVVTGAMVVGYRVIAYVALMRIGRMGRLKKG